MKVLTVDIGGTNIKFLATGHNESLKFPSGPKMTPKRMVTKIKKLGAVWKYDAVSLEYPGPVLRGQIIMEAHNLGKGWVGFDFEKAFGCPVKITLCRHLEVTRAARCCS
jgi:predicted NBD/HSP70 family sugar kinase